MIETDIERRAAKAGEAAVLVALNLNERPHAFAENSAEFRLLCSSAGLREVAYLSGKRDRPDPSLFVGKGKLEELRAVMEESGAHLVLFNHALSPGQQRNLERDLRATVIDRTALILDIFAQRAKSHEGKVQVELAQLRHLSTRLVRGWTHLERQKGGIGMRGPGETQLETDRRLIGHRVKHLADQLDKLQRQRATQRRARSRSGVFSISIVGYTNAGKSTLFNALTKGDSYAADQLFATLDTTSRKLYLEGAGQLVISDTVGFIRDLPTTLVAAFRATLEETIHADLLLHVVDAANPARNDQIDEVNAVLREIGAADVPQLLVWSKIDAAGLPARAERGDVTDLHDPAQAPDARISRVFVSARTGEGLSLLREALVEHATRDRAAQFRDLKARSDPDAILLPPTDQPDQPDQLVHFSHDSTDTPLLLA